MENYFVADIWPFSANTGNYMNLPNKSLLYQCDSSHNTYNSPQIVATIRIIWFFNLVAFYIWCRNGPI